MPDDLEHIYYKFGDNKNRLCIFLFISLKILAVNTTEIQ